MMDYENTLCRASGGQAVTTDAPCDNPITFGAAAPFIGMKRPVVKILVSEAFTGMASGLNIQLRVDTNVNLATAPKVINELPAKKITELTLGDMHQMVIPPVQLEASYQHIGLYFDLVSEAASAGKIIAWVEDKGESTDATTYAAI